MILIYQHIRFVAGTVCILICAAMFSGCSALISSATVRMTDNLSHAILNNNDLATVEAGAPAYLLMIDSLVEGEPDNESLLCSAATLYTSYTDVFVKDSARAKKLTDKALEYALGAVCQSNSSACALREEAFQSFEKIIAEMQKKDVPSLYALGTAWAAWIQTRQQDMNAIAEISRVEAIMKQIVKLDETYQDGGAHLYLGAMAILLPPALGGKPDVSRGHFERAIALSGGKNLMIKVVYARQYARALFDRELHDRLLGEVLKADPNVPGYVLSNTLARQEAQQLLDSAEDYF
jgi:hypothetical protein